MFIIGGDIQNSNANATYEFTPTLTNEKKREQMECRMDPPIYLNTALFKAGQGGIRHEPPTAK